MKRRLSSRALRFNYQSLRYSWSSDVILISLISNGLHTSIRLLPPAGSSHWSTPQLLCLMNTHLYLGVTNTSFKVAEAFRMVRGHWYGQTIETLGLTDQSREGQPGSKCLYSIYRERVSECIINADYLCISLAIMNARRLLRHFKRPDRWNISYNNNNHGSFKAPPRSTWRPPCNLSIALCSSVTTFTA